MMPSNGEKKIGVLVIDDSALIRKLLSEIINSQADMHVVATASNPLLAREQIKAFNPDVLTLDIEMPVMNGLDFLDKLMQLRPMPVVMVSTMTERGGDLTLRALELGAVDFVAKPKIGIEQGMLEYAEEICSKLRAAAGARIFGRPKNSASLSAVSSILRTSCAASSEQLIVIGASTGGTEALKEFLMAMPPDSPGILIAQHMPENFTRTFAQRLDSLCAISVHEAKDGQRVLPGHALIAPGHSHLVLRRSGANYIASLSNADPVNRHRPSVDVLFHSAAHHAGRNATGVILTGMGKDGAVGMLAMRRAGARTYAQNEATCVVFGMPREAIALDAVDEVLPLREIAPRVLRALESRQAIRI